MVLLSTLHNTSEISDSEDRKPPPTAASAGIVKAVQGAESCTEPPEAAAGAGKRRRCQFCPPKDYKKNTMCCTCEKYICNVHAPTLAYCPTCANSSLLIYTPCGWGQWGKWLKEWEKTSIL
jgi:hypothetical protein